MTCDSCVAKVKQSLEAHEGVTSASVRLSYPQATITTDREMELGELQQVLSQAGKYTISKEKKEPQLAPLPAIKRREQLPPVRLATYRPLILIISFIAGTCLLAQYPFGNFSGLLWMRHFMAGFFIVFSFFKLLNIKGFASSYRMYDLVAGKWHFWGYLYPFVELALGIAYLINFNPAATNLATVVILGISSIGVIQSNLNKRKIRCACLGDVFNLPMSTVTIIEDLSMVAMAVFMLL